LPQVLVFHGGVCKVGALGDVVTPKWGERVNMCKPASQWRQAAWR
jgi:hypothetical protein